MPAAKVRLAAAITILGLLHLVALGIMVRSEDAIVSKAAFVLAWGLINFFWLLVVGARRSRRCYRSQ
jgi:hypothetical protein